MHFRTRAALLAVVVAAAVTACSGGRGPLGPEYEYEEDLTLSLDGSATLVVNASVPALVALHGLPLNTDLRTRADQLKNDIRTIYSSPPAQVTRISNWNRHGRRFVGIRLNVRDVRALPEMRPFAWSKYELHEQGDQILYKHSLSGGTGTGSVSDIGWKGNEIVAFRLHLPARIRFHNSRDLETNAPRQPSRGNILTWEQRLTDRLAGKPIAYAEDKTPDVMEVRMDRQSILYTTLWLFGFAFLAALLVLAGLIWLTMRRGPADPGPSSHPQ
jgi:hypothetical protein